MMPGSKAQKERAARDVAELDGIIDEVLEASRLEARGLATRREPVDLLALLAEEGARHEVEVGGEAQCRPREGGGTIFEVHLAEGDG
jgi:hypothetical protein